MSCSHLKIKENFLVFPGELLLFFTTVWTPECLVNFWQSGSLEYLFGIFIGSIVSSFDEDLRTGRVSLVSLLCQFTHGYVTLSEPMVVMVFFLLTQTCWSEYKGFAHFSCLNGSSREIIQRLIEFESILMLSPEGNSRIPTAPDDDLLWFGPMLQVI